MEKRNVVRLELLTINRGVFNQMPVYEASNFREPEFEQLKQNFIAWAIMPDTNREGAGIYLITKKGSRIRGWHEAPMLYLTTLQKEEWFAKLPQVFVI